MNDQLLVWMLAVVGSWCCGLSAFGTIAALGVMGRYVADFTLPPHLRFLTHDIVFWPMVGLFAVEFVADKIPKLDARWNAANAYLRIVCAAALAAAAVRHLGINHAIGAGIVGFCLAFISTTVKTSIRLEAIGAGTAVIVSPIASLVEQCLLFAALFPLISTPFMCIVVMGFMLMAAMLTTFLIWPTIKQVARRTLFPWQPQHPRS